MNAMDRGYLTLNHTNRYTLEITLSYVLTQILRTLLCIL